jgi:hypothetical protein
MEVVATVGRGIAGVDLARLPRSERDIARTDAYDREDQR